MLTSEIFFVKWKGRGARRHYEHSKEMLRGGPLVFEGGGCMIWYRYNCSSTLSCPSNCFYSRDVFMYFSPCNRHFSAR